VEHGAYPGSATGAISPLVDISVDAHERTDATIHKVVHNGGQAWRPQCDQREFRNGRMRTENLATGRPHVLE
jgi:predicted lactoylglutathione lyase